MDSCTLGYTNYVKEALACVMDSQRNPVLFPKDADACSIDQVLEDFGFQVINLTQRSQYCEIRMLETCIQCALHKMPAIIIASSFAQFAAANLIVASVVFFKLLHYAEI